MSVLGHAETPMNPSILVSKDGEITGPFTIEALTQEVQEGRVSLDDSAQVDEDAPLQPVRELLGDIPVHSPASVVSASWFLDVASIKYPLSKNKTSIGRAPDRDVVIEDPTVSSSHAQLERTADGFLLRDLGSANGTFVNGVKVTEVLISPKDKIAFGRAPASLLSPVQPTQPLVEASPTPTQPKASETPEEDVDGPAKKSTLVLWIVVAAASWLFVLIMALNFFSGGSQAPVPASTSQQRQTVQQKALITPEQDILNHLQQELPIYKQNIFDSIHPVGTAKSLTVHDVTINWKPNTRHTQPQDILQFTVRFTLYWEGPVTKDGYTKLEKTYDNESQRWVNGSILETNGVTNSDTAYLGGFIGGTVLREMLQGNQ